MYKNKTKCPNPSVGLYITVRSFVKVPILIFKNIIILRVWGR